MDDLLMPNAYLKGLTLEAQSAIYGQSIIIPHFPFRVGRERRGPNPNPRRIGEQDRRLGQAKGVNDLYLWERNPQIHVSVEHFEIELAEGEFFLRDRHSILGTWVEGKLVGGNRRGGRVALAHADVIVVGGHQSGFIYKFLIETG